MSFPLLESVPNYSLLSTPLTVIKRDGRVVPFDTHRIEHALERCLYTVYQKHVPAELYVNRALNILKAKGGVPSVEDIQDILETVLIGAGEFEAAHTYASYRQAKTALRSERPIPHDARAAFDYAATYFPTQLQLFQFYDKYSRFDETLGRRETWIETVGRTVDFLYELAGDRLNREVYERIHKDILEMRAVPSMRLLATAGAAARRNNISVYNCSYLPVDDVAAFCEALYISMSGCGVGFSVERQYVEQFPRIKRQKRSAAKLQYTVEDSSEGWVYALRTGLETWFAGGDVDFDFSELRPAGSILRTKGGRASGPEPLHNLLAFARQRILAKQGSFLTPLNAHDIMCYVGTAAVSGGHRRTAMLSLFDYDDDEMLRCKSGDFEKDNNQRWNANNSAVWTKNDISQAEFADRFLEMIKSERGEPGIFNRLAANAMKPERRVAADFGTNPCGEINLLPNEFCNLTAAIARQDDTIETLLDKVETASIIGTIQSLATNFPILRPFWIQNCERERLLGVDINGQMDSKVAQDASVQKLLRWQAVETNRAYTSRLNINQSAAVTCVKPSGNSATLLDCSSGLHARWAKYYIRNVRVAATSPVYKVLRDAGVPMDIENGQEIETANTYVVHFPVKAPEDAITRHDRSALEQCDYWLQVKLNYTEHNPSVTITYKPDEVLDLMKWVYEHRESIGGMAFLPSYDADYAQLPYVEITAEEYEQRAAEFPEIDFSKLFQYEIDDHSTATSEVACMAGNCDVEQVPLLPLAA